MTVRDEATGPTRALTLAHEFSYRADLKPPVEIGTGPYGTRMFFEVTGGTVEGERINGSIGTGGGDWLVVDPRGSAHLDVRSLIVTRDDATIYLAYHGHLEMSQSVQAALAGEGPTDWEDQYFRTAPRLETGDERYAWVNRTLFVAEGRLYPDPAVEYRVYRVD